MAVPWAYSNVNNTQVAFNAAGLPLTSSLPPPLKTLPGGAPPWRAPPKALGRVSMPLPKPVSISHPAPKPAATPKSHQWPPSLKAFVDRCFMACNSDAQKDLMEEFLRKRINSCIENGTLQTVNWALESIPLSINPSVSLQSDNPDEYTGNERKRARLDRFRNDSSSKPLKKPAASGDDFQVIQGAPIVGTSHSLEKRYLRLTAPPDPSTVRPISVLRKSLDMIVEKYRDGKEYNYLCDQLKSIRQDITVQNIKDNFAVLVYETHARIAIQNGDLGEYNQCQTQLKELYSLGFIGNECEFTSYRLLYLLITKNAVDINYELKGLDEEMMKNDDISTALTIHFCIATSDHVGLLDACSKVKNFGQYIISSLIAQNRIDMVGNLSKVVKPKLEIDHLSSLLDLDSDLCKELLSQVGHY